MKWAASASDRRSNSAQVTTRSPWISAARSGCAAATASQMSAMVQPMASRLPTLRVRLLLVGPDLAVCRGVKSNGDRGRGLDLLHGEGGRNVRQRGGGDQALVEGVVGGDVLHQHLQQIVDLARQ